MLLLLQRYFDVITLKQCKKCKFKDYYFISVMTTFITNTLICPHCKNRMYSFEITSYFINKSEVFSDGKVDSDSPIPSDYKILICSTCNKPFWKEEALLADQKIDDSTTDLLEANNIPNLFPGFEEDHLQKHTIFYTDLLDMDFADTEEKETYIRIKIWHLLNDRIRYQTSSVFSNLFEYHKKQTDSAKIKDLFKNNLLRLAKIYKPNTDESQLLMAEMYRELGDFENASYLLDSMDTKNNSAYQQIYEASKRNKIKVFKLVK